MIGQENVLEGHNLPKDVPGRREEDCDADVSLTPGPSAPVAGDALKKNSTLHGNIPIENEYSVILPKAGLSPLQNKRSVRLRR